MWQPETVMGGVNMFVQLKYKSDFSLRPHISSIVAIFFQEVFEKLRDVYYNVCDKVYACCILHFSKRYNMYRNIILKMILRKWNRQTFSEAPFSNIIYLMSVRIWNSGLLFLNGSYYAEWANV